MGEYGIGDTESPIPDPDREWRERFCMVNIQPGISGEILFEEAGAKDRPVGFPTTIYSVSERRILLAQTDPPLSADDPGGTMVFTYVIHKESAPAKGFPPW